MVDVWPNPAIVGHELFIDLDISDLQTSQLEYEIVDITGQIITPKTALGSSKISAPSIPGVFFVRIYSDRHRKIFRSRIVIQ